MQQPPAGQTPVSYGPPPMNTMALVSMVAGIASFIFAPVIGAIVAIITGHVARGQIRRSGESGSGMALVGLILGYLHVVVVLIGIAILVALVGLGISLGTRPGS